MADPLFRHAGSEQAQQARAEAQKAMTFRDLLPGQVFKFVSADGHDCMRGGSKGPWVKMSAGTYASLDHYTRYSGKPGIFYQTSARARVRAVKGEASE